jgi:hypothetical protein
MTELGERFAVIERMVLESRRSVERWSWAYVLWGAGHVLGVVATLTLPAERIGLAWLVLMGGCGVGTAIMARRTAKKKDVETHMGRAISAVWWTFGLMVMCLCLTVERTPSGSSIGFLASPGSLSAFSTALGGAFFASGKITRWAPMTVNGLLWCAGAVAMKFLAGTAIVVVFGALALIGEVGFGLYAIAHERKATSGGG